MCCGHQFLKSEGWVLKVAVFGVFLAIETTAQAAMSGPLTADEIRKGKDLHELKCAKCHRLYDPADYDRESWESWMAKMKKKAHLDEEQVRLIRGYLESLRENKKA